MSKVVPIRLQQEKAKGAHPSGSTSTALVQITLRVPRELFEQIKTEAIDQRRSIAAQTLVMLESALSVE